MKKLILFIILFLCFISKANASENITVNYIPNVYVNYMRGDVPHWGQFAYIYADNDLLYCIDTNKDIITSVYDLYPSTDLSYNIKEELEIINYYGYKYEGHNNLYYYMATQELIWNRLGVQVYWTTESNGKGSIINVDQYKNEIMNLYNNHIVIPSFSEPISDVRVGSEIIFNDMNNVINEYQVIYNGDNIINIEDNTLVIKSYKTGLDTFSIKRKINDIGDTIIYKAEDSQMLIKLGNAKNDEIVYNFTVHGGNIFIQKLDFDLLTNMPYEGTSLEHSLYGIYDSNNNLVVWAMTDANGVYSANNIPLGDYTIRESTPSKGYKLDEKEYKVSLSYGNVDKTVYTLGEVIKKKLEINKTYKDNTNIKPEFEAGFYIYKDNVLICSFTTDENGYSAVLLPYGSYVIKQSSSKEGYKKVEDFEFIVNEENTQTVFNLLDEKEVVEEQKDIIDEKSSDEQNDPSDDESKLVDEEYVDKNIDDNEIKTQEIIEDINISKLPLLYEKNNDNYILLLILIITNILIIKHVQTI